MTLPRTWHKVQYFPDKIVFGIPTKRHRVLCRRGNHARIRYAWAFLDRIDITCPRCQTVISSKPLIIQGKKLDYIQIDEK